MPLAKPIDLLEVVTQAINTGNIDAQMAIYEPDAYFNFEPGPEVQ
jgi:hypothetical protein